MKATEFIKRYYFHETKTNESRKELESLPQMYFVQGTNIGNVMISNKIGQMSKRKKSECYGSESIKYDKFLMTC